MADRGFGQAEVDEMELWVIAEVLGVNREHAARETGIVTAEQHADQSADLIRRRIAAAQSGEKVTPPVPGFQPMTVTDDMAAALAARRVHRKEHTPGPVPGCTFCVEEMN